MQFGIQCVEEIRCTYEVIFQGEIQNIRELNRQESKERWTEVWDLVFMLTDHLRKSPVFYPGEEFIEEVYKKYLLDEDTMILAIGYYREGRGIHKANR